MSWVEVAAASFIGVLGLLGCIWRNHRTHQRSLHAGRIEAGLPPLNQDIQDEINRELQKRDQS